MIEILPKHLKRILILLFILCYIFEYQYEEELIVSISVFTCLIIISNSFAFYKKKKKSIELGEPEYFSGSPWSVILLLGGLLVLIFYVIPWLNELNLFSGMKGEITLIHSISLLMPGITELIMSYLFTDMIIKYYATDEGLLKNLEAKEEMSWQDFYSFKIIESHNIIKFQKKSLEYFFIKYDEEYFSNHREEIISFLEKKVTRE